MDIDRNFLEEMLIMEEDKDRRLAEKLVTLPRSEESRTVELTASERQLLDTHGVDIRVHHKLPQIVDHLLIRLDIPGIEKCHQSLGTSSFLLILFSFFHKSKHSKQNEQK